VAGQRIDWRRAKHPKHDETPLVEISIREALEDQEFLAKCAVLNKKRRKYVRSTPKERALRKLMEMPETVQERRLRTVLAALSDGKSMFQFTAAEDASHRLFERKDVKLRLKIDPSMRRELIAASPGDPRSFDWVRVSVAPGVLEDRSADFLAARLRDLISKQSLLQRARNA
jgi:DNA-binding MarR family transcriptional regulator